MDPNGFLTGDEAATTYVKPLGRDWKQVTYTVVGGRAVFEGCIILGTVQDMRNVAQAIQQNPGLLAPGAQHFGAAIKGVQYRWPGRIVPYEIDPDLPDPQRVTDAIKHWEDNTPFRFVPRQPAHADYVVFQPGDGCASSVGCRGGRQEVILGPRCSRGNCIHEIGHTVGLWHEQSRADREQYIRINWANIIPNTRHNFDQHIEDGIDLGGYDYGSIMHYPKDAFSSNGEETIVPLQAGQAIGQRIRLSAGDIAAVQEL